MTNPTPAQVPALIELADHPQGTRLDGVRTRTLEAMRLNEWVTMEAQPRRDGEARRNVIWHLTRAGYDAITRTRDGRAFLDTVWDAAHLGYARSHGPLTPHGLLALIDLYRTTMDSAGRLDDAVHYRTADLLRARAVFILARLAAAVNAHTWQHPHDILRQAEQLFADTDPVTARRDRVAADAQTATCVNDARPIARRSAGTHWHHIDPRAGRLCFADHTRTETATPLPDGDQGDVRPAIAEVCSSPLPHRAHPWGDLVGVRYLCRGNWDGPRAAAVPAGVVPEVEATAGA